jgi:hypothetical protein
MMRKVDEYRKNPETFCYIPGFILLPNLVSFFNSFVKPFRISPQFLILDTFFWGHLTFIGIGYTLF